MSRVDKKKKTAPKNKKKEEQKKESLKEKTKDSAVKKEIQNNTIEQKERNDKKQEKHEQPSHLKTFLKVFFILFLFIFISLYYMRFIETKMLFVKEVKIENSLIPESLSGLKIVHFSDLHYGVSTGKDELDKLVKKIQLIRPDILVFTGDLLDERVTYKEEDYSALTDALSKMEVPISKYYVKGNQDYANERVERIFEASGFISLNNECDIVYGNTTEKIQLVGMGSFLQNDFKQEKAFEKAEEGLYTISLFHEPDNIMELQNRNIQLALAGHSHNNQNGIPYIRNIFTKEGARTYYDNHYQINTTELYINSGIGTNHHKLRIFSPPTINLYRLVKS